MKIALGTVQFGQAYGAFNRGGQVAQDEVRRILDLAQATSIDTLDTAHAYGTSEAVLGSQRSGERFRIVTKIPALDGSDAATRVSEVFAESLARLQISHVYGLLLHRATDLLDKAGESVWRLLQQFRESGQVQRVGFSAYGPEEALEVLRRYPVELVQLPLNVFDTRHRESGVLDLCQARGIEVHVRSVFLQGFALQEPDALTGHLAAHRAVLKRFRERCSALGVAPLRAALRYALDLPQVCKVVIGVESRRQLAEIVGAASGVALPVGALDGLACDDLSLVEPSRWK